MQDGARCGRIRCSGKQFTRSARLALDASLHGHGYGYGAQVLLDALDEVVRAAEIGGGRLIVVDAIDDEAYAFYEHFDFMPVKNRRGLSRHDVLVPFAGGQRGNYRLRGHCDGGRFCPRYSGTGT